LDAPVTIATLLDSLLIFTIVLDSTPRTTERRSLSRDLPILAVAPMKKQIDEKGWFRPVQCFVS